MRFGYWLPVFGGWLRNVEEENMQPTWDYVKRLAIRSEEIGFDLALIAELYLNDIKGEEEPSLDAWSTAAALAAVTSKQELMVAVRPTFHNPAQLAKQAANIDHISNGRISLNVVSSWWKDEAEKYGIAFEQHDDRYARTAEWLEVLDNVWKKDHYSFEGKYYKVKDNILQPKPVSTPRPPIYAGGESEAAKELISSTCDGYVMHGDTPELIARRINDLSERRDKKGLPPMQFGVAAYSIIRDTEQEVKKELDRITNVQEGSSGYKNYQQWLSGTQLDQHVSLHDYSVSNRGLRSGLTGTPAQVQDRIGEFEKVGVNFFLLQCSPQLEEMERFADAVIETKSALVQ
ncbi:FMNH2-dependent dimethyl sulfone monooxygenase [Mucilaginibacter gracilis]|uniref:FMNH2-dependent dimethyl sulfone monooxygenase n=1 Tax=Mucilaginibacter gracilis TaxID=423350 RepID=A0A495IUL1_9SPHI|nr:LLM class flavin-dependent oxidoreductase [Mucilaginibacter gracilis]RKR80435.1 FMNH2-dependent dimethyl sulfone monooxygenase [Mucilaginibacter gracilis]